jgi:hypothetical protein
LLGGNPTETTQFYDRLNKYTIQDGQGYIIIVVDGCVLPTPSVAFDVTVWQTFEVVADSRTIEFGANSQPVYTEPLATAKVIDLSNQMHEIGAGHPVAPGTVGKLADGFGKVMEGAVASVGKESKGVVAEIGQEVMGALNANSEGIGGEILADLGDALIGALAL